MNPTELVDPNVPIKTKLIAWIVDQGVATVLLFFIAWQIPHAVEHVNQGYEKNAVHLKVAANVYEANTQRILDALVANQRLILELAQNQKVFNEKLKARDD